MIDPDKKEFMLTNHVKFLHKVAIVCGDKVLVLQRKSDEYSRPNAWDLPGGNSNWPETDNLLENPHLLDIVKEIKEETGLETNPSQLLVNTVLSGFDPGKLKYTVLLGWKLQWPDPALPQITLSEHQTYRWIKENEIDQLDFGKDGGYLQEIIKIALNKK